jgi:hypothetical protein
MRLYLAGPMTGLPELNFPLFHARAARLRELGFEIVNPAEINADPKANWRQCMRADIRELVGCDGIVMLPGWEKSKGASLEHHIAKSLSMAIFASADDLIDYMERRPGMLLSPEQASSC